MTAAIAAARAGAEVVILERLSRVGKKLLATGNGRCNYTNTDIDISRYHGNQPKFAVGPLNRFGSKDTIAFFGELGIVPMVEQKGKVFPRSGQAGSVLDVLRFELERLGVRTVCDAEVASLQHRRQGFVVKAAEGGPYSADSVILATGGKASPNLGSNGSGYNLAQSFGHTLVNPFPALVQLKLNADFWKQIAGIKVEGTAEILFDGKVLASDAGEILFTTYGISGPPVLQISRAAGEKLQQRKTPQVRLNLVPDLSCKELQALMQERFETQAEKALDFSFVGFLNKQLAPVLIKAAGIADVRKAAGEVTPTEQERLLNILQDWRFDITDTLPWSQAQVTAGGINTDEINPRTMESRIIPRLYFAGEIMDIEGDSGGFNLQWAWASGWIAGNAAAN